MNEPKFEIDPKKILKFKEGITRFRFNLLDIYNNLAPKLKKINEELIEPYITSENIERFKLGVEKIQRMQPYIDIALADFDDPDLKIANEVISFEHLYSYIDFDLPPENFKLIDVVKGEAFQSDFLSTFKNLNLNFDRYKILKDILDLHNKNFYTGAISLLYGQIEGVLTDFFILEKMMKEHDGKVVALNLNGSINFIKRGQPQYLNGLIPKIEHASTVKNDICLKIISADEKKKLNLKSYELVFGDKASTISQTRNKVLHGQSVNFATKKRSAQLIMWLYSIICKIDSHQK